MKKLLVFVMCILLGSTSNIQSQMGVFESAVDVGNPKIGGDTDFNPEEQVYTIKGGGYNIWFDRDEFHYPHSKISGDFILTANFSLVGEGVDAHRKVGWMIRESLEDDAPHVSATLHGDGLTLMQFRRLKGAEMQSPRDEMFAPKKNYQVIQLERSGNKITMRAAMTGEPLQEVGTINTMDLPDEILAGIFVCSHNPEVQEQAKAWNVRIDKPVADDYNPYQQGFLRSRLETIDVGTGKRKVIHTHNTRFEAPNWMPDGKRLLFNQDGSIFTINLNGEGLEKVNTGPADRNNNDHGISFNGKLLAISHHRDGLPGGGSSIYVLPLEGGDPKLVTEKTPSYWHGWAPNNKEVVYVAQREADNYDIYSININGGQEKKLTSYTGAHADGPEYSPDGKYIYYNANPTGTMQIWRMKADGSQNRRTNYLRSM